jgi:hypothetical protein
MIQPKLDYYDMGPAVTAFSTTRHGGYSTGHPASAANYAEFNINRYCGDEEEHIRKNREALCSLLAISDDRLLMPHQVHETKVVKIDEALLALPEKQRHEALEGYDALMTDRHGVCIGVSTADCIPVLLYDEARHAVCAIHAGWRGTVNRIATKAVEAMTETYGTRPEQLVAQIGPGIHLESFEVGDEVYEAFDQAGFDMSIISKQYPCKECGSQLFTLHSSFDKLRINHSSLLTSKWHIDLPECNRQQLIAAGLQPQSIDVSPVCTYQQADDYFSARHLGINSGRIFTGIIIKAPQK